LFVHSLHQHGLLVLEINSGKKNRFNKIVFADKFLGINGQAQESKLNRERDRERAQVRERETFQERELNREREFKMSYSGIMQELCRFEN
jgi:hypothetical protein